MVASSRIVDNWHHPSDVVAGTMLGVAGAAIAYHLFYNPVSSSRAGIPLSSSSARKLEKLPSVHE